jgi:hypothetical protein
MTVGARIAAREPSDRSYNFWPRAAAPSWLYCAAWGFIGSLEDRRAMESRGAQ